MALGNRLALALTLSLLCLAPASAGVRSMGYGPQGAQGDAGAAGPVGSTGPTGAQGAAGSTGAVGPMGPSGPAGVAGPRGADGATGPAGVAGPTGATGPAGKDGAAGAQGNTGAIGPAGPQGAVGAQGSQGVAGATGPAGPQGATGPAGASAPVYGASGLISGAKHWVGTVSTDSSGNWTADISRAGCSAAPLSVQPTAKSADQTAASTLWANVVSVTATSLTGSVTKPNAIAVLGLLPNAKAGAGVAVLLDVTCQ